MSSLTLPDKHFAWWTAISAELRAGKCGNLISVRKRDDEGVPHHSRALGKYPTTFWEEELWSGSPRLLTRTLNLALCSHTWLALPVVPLSREAHAGGESPWSLSPLKVSHCFSFYHLSGIQPQPLAPLWLLIFWKHLTGTSSLSLKWSASNIFSNKSLPLLTKLMETPYELEGRSEHVAETQPHRLTGALQDLCTQQLFCLNQLVLYWTMGKTAMGSAHPCFAHHVFHTESPSLVFHNVGNQVSVRTCQVNEARFREDAEVPP